MVKLHINAEIGLLPLKICFREEEISLRISGQEGVIGEEKAAEHLAELELELTRHGITHDIEMRGRFIQCLRFSRLQKPEEAQCIILNAASR